MDLETRRDQIICYSLLTSETRIVRVMTGRVTWDNWNVAKGNGDL